MNIDNVTDILVLYSYFTFSNSFKEPVNLFFAATGKSQSSVSLTKTNKVQLTYNGNVKVVLKKIKNNEQRN